MKVIGKNRMILGMGILVTVSLAIVGAMILDAGIYLSAVVGPAFLAFGHLISKDDDSQKGAESIMRMLRWLRGEDSHVLFEATTSRGKDGKYRSLSTAR